MGNRFERALVWMGRRRLEFESNVHIIPQATPEELAELRLMFSASIEALAILARQPAPQPEGHVAEAISLSEAMYQLGPDIQFCVEYDKFIGTQVGAYITREGKPGVVLQQVGTKVVHVYGRNRIEPVDNAMRQREAG